MNKWINEFLPKRFLLRFTTCYSESSHAYFADYHKKDNEITPFASIAEVFSLGLQQVFHNSLEYEAVYLMTLLVGLSYRAHTMLEIQSAAGGCIKDGASFIQVFKLVHSCDWLHTSGFWRWECCVHSFSSWTRSFAFQFFSIFSALRQISPASVFHKFMPR